MAAHEGFGDKTLTYSPDRIPPPMSDVGSIRCQSFLGGLLRHYCLAAA